MTDAVLEAESISFAYGDELVLDNVSLRVGRGELVALVGPNGSGKSTLVRIMLGLLTPASGRALLFGTDPGHSRGGGRVGYVPQRPFVESGVPATVEEVVACGRLARGGWWRRPSRADREGVDAALRTVGLEEHRRHRCGELSGGQQQRVFIARALATQPELLVLDEPVAGVDAESQRRFRDSITGLVHEHGGSVLLVSHELGSVASDLDRVVVLKRSVRFDGPPDALVREGVSLGIHAEDLPLWLEELR